jgi:glycosyltransferase involved in cell wall biosynthesis
MQIIIKKRKIDCKMKPRYIFLHSHPIQYFVPFYQLLDQNSKFDFEVLFFSDETILGKKDLEFGKFFKWDIPLLEMYPYKFLKNYSFRPTIDFGFWGLVNFGIIPYLFRSRKAKVVVYGWNYFSYVSSIIVAKIFGHTVCLKAENPLNQELLKNRYTTFFKHLCLRILFSFVDEFWYIGNQNYLFYINLGVSKSKLKFSPYCVDNKRFNSFFTQLSKSEARSLVGLPLSKKIILFSAKFIQKKRPFDLLYAIKDLKDDYLLVMVGDGYLRSEIEKYILQNSLDDYVKIVGFINQSSIPLYYRSADVFVLCSGIGETWGLSVNEALNFYLPVVVSQTSGCSFDLVDDGINGFVFNEGDIGELIFSLKEVFSSGMITKNEFFDSINKKLKIFSYENVIR